MSQTGSQLERLGAFAASAALVGSPGVALGQAGAPGQSGAPSAGQSTESSEDSFFLPAIERRFALVERILLPYAVLLDVPPATSEEGHFVALNLGVLYGFADRWMVDAVFAPLVLSDSFRYGNPELGLAYQVVDSRPFELGLTGRVFFSTSGVVVGGIEPGIATVLRMGQARLDVGAYVPISTSGQPVGVLGAGRVGLRVPVVGWYQLGTHVHVALNTGATFSDLGAVGDSFALPLGISGGWSTNIHGYWVDAVPFFSFPTFYGEGGVDTEHMSLGLILDFSKKL